MKTAIIVEITDLKIEPPANDTRGSYEFRYRVDILSGLHPLKVLTGKLDSTFTVPVENIRNAFAKKGYAEQLVMQHIF